MIENEFVSISWDDYNKQILDHINIIPGSTSTGYMLNWTTEHENLCVTYDDQGRPQSYTIWRK